jgi:hypothetical protein
MLRCAFLALTALTAGALALPAAAQMSRPFPATALRGELVVTQPPEVLVNRRQARLAPGARIRGADNLLLMSGALIGQRLLVHYTVEPGGELLDVWVLTPAEAARNPWPRTLAEAANWSFNPDAQTWSRP